MDRANTIMERLGFRDEANDDTKAAFLKNLIKQAYGVEVKIPPQYQTESQQPRTLEEHNAEILSGGAKAKHEEVSQLSFNFDSPKAG